jgi:hypothetical protein
MSGGSGPAVKKNFLLELQSEKKLLKLENGFFDQPFHLFLSKHFKAQ